MAYMYIIIDTYRHLLSRNMEFPNMILLDVLFLFFIRKGYGVYVYNYRHI